jgi:hypothetical protein
MTVIEPDARVGYDPGESLAVGWTAFAGVGMLLLSVLNGIEGIAAISSSQFFGRGDMIVGDLQTWGWVLCAIAVAQLVAAPLVWMSNPVGMLIGVAATAVNAIVQMLFIPAYPFWSLAIFALNLVVMRGLVVHPSARRTAMEGQS